MRVGNLFAQGVFAHFGSVCVDRSGSFVTVLLPTLD